MRVTARVMRCTCPGDGGGDPCERGGGASGTPRSHEPSRRGPGTLAGERESAPMEPPGDAAGCCHARMCGWGGGWRLGADDVAASFRHARRLPYLLSVACPTCPQSPAARAPSGRAESASRCKRAKHRLDASPHRPRPSAAASSRPPHRSASHPPPSVVAGSARPRGGTTQSRSSPAWAAGGAPPER